MPSWPSSNAWPSSRNWPAGNAWPSGNNWPADFNGNLASLFPGAYQVVQSDRGLTYGGTMLATAGNTSTTVLTLTGTLATVPVPIWAKATNTLAIGAGAQFNIYYDGLGVTPAMTGVTPTAGVPVALTGAGFGLSTTWAAGTSVTNDSWKATCSALADQSGNGLDYSQANAAKQPIVTVGVGGKVGVRYDGVDDFLSSSVGTLLTPGLAYQIIVLGRFTTSVAANKGLVCGASSVGVVYSNTGNNLVTYNGAGGPTLVFSSLANTRFSAVFRQGVGNDTLQAGAIVATPAVGASAIDNTRNIAVVNGILFADVEIFSVAYVPIQPNLTAFDAAINSASGWGPGAFAV